MSDDRLLPSDAYLATIRREAEALATAAGKDLGARVPACPDWDVAALVRHVGGVHGAWTQVVERQLQSPDEIADPGVPDDDADLLRWFLDGVERLTAALADADPTTRVWTWAPQQDVAWVLRRMAHETAVHRWDAEVAVGDPAPVDEALALDGVDEWFSFFGEPGGSGGTIALEATDGQVAWVVHEDGSLVPPDDGRHLAQAVVHAPASDLLLLLWRRRTVDHVRIDGDRDLVASFLARTELA